jgi:hypothetical protein
MKQLATTTLVLGFAPDGGGWVTAAAKGPTRLSRTCRR